MTSFRNLISAAILKDGSAEMKPDRFDWAVEPLTQDPSFIQKPMFGCLAYYFGGRLVLVTAAQKQPWQGLLVPTFKEFHASLKKEIPALKKHPVLGKWLYLPEAGDDFEENAGKIIRLIRMRHARLGVDVTKAIKPNR